MITAETLQCISTVRPPGFVELIPNWATTVTCNLPSAQLGWEFAVQAAAAIGTVGALIASIALSYKARKEASRLEFFRRELDRFEEIKTDLSDIPQWIIDEPESVASRIRSISHAAETWIVYARTRNKKLADSWYGVLDSLQGIALTLATVNDGGIPNTPGYEKEQEALSSWIDKNPRYEFILNSDTNACLGVMTAFYAGAISKRKALALTATQKSELSQKYKVHAEYFKKRAEHNRK